MMKKRRLSVLLALCLILTMMPANAWVASGVNEVSSAATEILNKCTSAAIVTDTTSYSNLVSNSTVGEVVRLTGDCELTGAAIKLTTGSITLDLNGFTIRRNTGSSDSELDAVINVSGAALNIVDTSVSGMGSIYNTHNNTPKGSGIYQSGGTVNLYSGTILASGQAHNLQGGTFNMYGGQLIGIRSVNTGYGLSEALTASGGTFNIYAGYLTGADADFWKDTTVTGSLQGGYYHDNSMAAYVAAGSTLAALSVSGLPNVTISAITGEYSLGKWVYKTSTSGISLKIPDTANSGDQLKAQFQLSGNTETFLTASYTWQRSQNEVQWSDIAGATNKYYKIVSEDAGNKLRVVAQIGGTTLTSGTFTVYPKQLVNGGFESPTISLSPNSQWFLYRTISSAEQEQFGWKKTGTGTYEFGGDWNVNGWGIQFIPEGRQFIELNSNTQSAIYQDLLTSPGEVFYWSLYQGGVWYNDNEGGQNINNTMVVRIGHPAELNTEATMISRADTLYDQEWTSRTIYEIDSKNVVTSIPAAYVDRDGKNRLYTEPKRWTKYEGTYTVPPGQTVTRFVFASLSENPLRGNLLDDVVFTSDRNYTPQAAASNLTPAVGVGDAITLTAIGINGNKDTNYNGNKTVTITGYEMAPDTSYGSFGGQVLEGDGSTDVEVAFTAGVATPNLKLYKADMQKIRFSISGVSTDITITPSPGTTTSMAVTQDITAPATNGGLFAQQPKIALTDAYGNICTSDNSTVVTAAKEDAGTWTLTGTTTAMAINGIATFNNLGATNATLVSNAQIGFTSEAFPMVASAAVTLPAPEATSPASVVTKSRGRSGSTKTTTVQTTIVLINGEQQNAGTETISSEQGKSIVTVAVNNSLIKNKIEEAAKKNTAGTDNFLQVPIADTKSKVAKAELTGDIVKKLEENRFDVSVKRDAIEYIIPAEEITISKVAETLGVKETDLEDIRVEVKITKPDEAAVAKYNEVAKANGATMVFPPVSFEVVAKTTRADGSTGEVSVSKFRNFVERVMEIPAKGDPGKIKTGIVFNPDGTYSQVSTSVYQKDGKWYAKTIAPVQSVAFVVNSNQSTYTTLKGETKKQEMDVAPMIYEGRTFLPIRYVLEPLGGTSAWNQKEKKITITDGNRTIELWPGKNQAMVNGTPVMIDPDNSNIAPMIIDGRAMLPVRFIAEDLGYTVGWNQKDKSTTISKPVTAASNTSTLAIAPAAITVTYSIGNATATVSERDGKSAVKQLNAPPVLYLERTYIPVKEIIPALGGTSSWNQAEKKMTIKANGTTIEAWLGSNTAKVNGTLVKIDAKDPNVTPILSNSGTGMLPQQFLMKQLGYKVIWDQENRTTTITLN